MKKITLICAAGMSTSLLVAKMKKAAEQLGEEVEIRAVSERQFNKYEKDTDVLLLGPQVGFMLKKFKEKYESSGMAIEVINSVDYGLMNGEKVLKRALTI